MIFQKMIILFLLMLVGFVLYKKRVLDPGSIRAFTFIVINIANPAMIIASAFSAEKNSRGSELLLTLLISVVMYAALIVLSFLVPRILRVKKSEVGIYQAMTVFANVGFMGFPVISSVYGPQALLFASIFLLPNNVLIYTYGIYLMKKDRVKSEKARTDLRQIFNIGVIACLCAIVLYMFKISLPDFAEASITHLSNLIVPLSMMVIGASLADVHLREIIRDVKLIIFSVIKLLIIPIAGCLILRIAVQNEVILGVSVVMLAMPVGSMTSMIAQQYGGDHELASKYVAATTALSVLTVPIVFHLF